LNFIDIRWVYNTKATCLLYGKHDPDTTKPLAVVVGLAGESRIFRGNIEVLVQSLSVTPVYRHNSLDIADEWR
jgi:hypothetical protein